MKRVLIAAALLLTVAFVLTGFAVADPLKSGPQVGQEVPGPFHPLNVTGAKAGQKNCLYCQNGSNPVAMIFAREVSEPLTKLIKKVDADIELGAYGIANLIGGFFAAPTSVGSIASAGPLANIATRSLPSSAIGTPSAKSERGTITATSLA